MRRFTLLAPVTICVAVASALTMKGHAYATYGSWTTNPVVYYINPQNLDVSPDAAEAAVQVAADAWNTQGGANFSWVYGGRVTDTATGYDHRNVVVFRPATNDSALATTYWWTIGPQIVDADVIFWDSAYTFSTDPCNGGYNIADIATHELGHALGLLHSSVGSATMYFMYSWCGDWRILDPDDVTAIQALYGSSGTSNTAPSVTIQGPGNYSTFHLGDSIAFNGTSADTQDGDLTATLVWTSNIDGEIGRGGVFSRSLSAGTHTITASATDSGGMVTSRQETVAVVVPCGHAIPTVMMSPSGVVSVAMGATQSYTVQVKNTDDSSCSASTFALQPSIPAGWTAVLGVLQMTLNPGAGASTTLKVSSPVGTPAGGYAAGVSATNKAATAFAGWASVTENVVSSLTVKVSTDYAAYVVGQTVNMWATVMMGTSPAASTRVTIIVTKPDGSVFKKFTPNTNGSGLAKASFKAATPRGTYGITATATKNALSGAGSASVTVQ
jgi:matrixin/alpha-galactosidase-like protein